MAVILAAGSTAAVSSDVTVAAGDSVTLSIYASTGSIPPGVDFIIKKDSSGVDVYVGRLNAYNPSTVLSGPGVFRVRRPLLATGSVGVETDV